VQSQRFRPVAALRGCLTGSRTIGAGDPDTVAVTRLQDSLSQLGYLPASEVDGIFGERTGKAVTRFKQDNDLTPDNPVVGRGTMTALDAVFAGEPDDGDHPDPSTEGLGDLADQARVRAEVWVRDAATAIATWPDPPQPGEAVSDLRAGWERALVRNLHLPRTEQDAWWVDHAVRPMLEALPRTLELLQVRPSTRAEFADVSSTYEAVDLLPGLVTWLTPPFRNALTRDQQAGELLHFAVAVAYPHARTMGRPGTRRYEKFTTSECAINTWSWVALCREARGGTASFPPEPIWYP
jgi:peptidoglycan hydrolase-like protein with peptidoglycan-binding domain